MKVLQSGLIAHLFRRYSDVRSPKCVSQDVSWSLFNVKAASEQLALAAKTAENR